MWGEVHVSMSRHCAVEARCMSRSIGLGLVGQTRPGWLSLSFRALYTHIDVHLHHLGVGRQPTHDAAVFGLRGRRSSYVRK
jgi:hypothetical protein